MNARRSIKGAVGAVLVAALLASCGDDDKGVSTSVTESPETTAATAMSEAPDATEAPVVTEAEATTTEPAVATDGQYDVCGLLEDALLATLPGTQWDPPELDDFGDWVMCVFTPAGGGLSSSIELTVQDAEADLDLQAVEEDPTLAEALTGVGERALHRTGTNGAVVWFVVAGKSWAVHLGYESEHLGTEVAIATAVAEALIT